MKFDSVPAHSFPHAKKGELTKIDNPGPGKYSPTKSNLYHEPHWKIGTTKRNPFNIKDQYPGPGTYSIPMNIELGPKYSIATKAGLKENKDKFDFPGPASYKPMMSRSQSCFYTFGHKNKLREREKTPGPGNYNLRKDKDLVIPSYLFGKEIREDKLIKRKKIIPGPGKYEFTKDHILLRHPKYSFGHEKKIRNFSSIGPGPGSYSFQEFIGKDGPKKTMGIKLNYRKFDGVDTPGPGQYKESKTDAYLPKPPIMKIGKSKRVNELTNPTNKTPGPGQYNDDKTIKYIKIKHPSWKIGSSQRRALSQSDKNVPGVGNYNISGSFGKYAPHYTMRIKGSSSNYKTDVPGPGQYKNEKMNLYKHYPSWKIGTSSRDDEMRRTIKEGFPGPGKYGFKSMKDFFAPKYRFGTKKRFSKHFCDTPGPGSYHIPCSIVDVTNYTREQGKFDNRFKFI